MVTACKTPEYRLERLHELLKSSRGVAENRRAELNYLRMLLGKIVNHFEVGKNDCSTCSELMNKARAEARDYAS